MGGIWRRRDARLGIVDGTSVGRAEGTVADKVVVGVVNLKSEGGEEEERPDLVQREHAVAR